MISALSRTQEDMSGREFGCIYTAIPESTPVDVRHGPVQAVMQPLPADLCCLRHLPGDEGSLNPPNDVTVQERGAT